MPNTLEHGLTVLEFLGEHGEAALNDLTVHLGLSRATTFRILGTLQARGYVQHARSDKLYRLGPTMETLSSKSAALSVLRVSAPAMADLRSTTAETVNLALLQGGRIVYAVIFEGSHVLRMSPRVGDEVPAHATAIGKAVLSVLPDMERKVLVGKEPYPALTTRTMVRRRDLEAALAEVRRHGFAVDDEEGEVGAVCVAAPIIGADGYPLGALSVSALAARMPEQRRNEVGESLRRWCAHIAETLAGAGRPQGERAPRGKVAVS